MSRYVLMILVAYPEQKVESKEQAFGALQSAADCHGF
jgi:hypothetical protein